MCRVSGNWLSLAAQRRDLLESMEECGAGGRCRNSWLGTGQAEDILLILCTFLWFSKVCGMEGVGSKAFTSLASDVGRWVGD